MTSEIQQTRYDQTIRRVGGIIGPGSKVAEALGELFPVIDVERVPGELLLLGGTRLCFGGITVTGSAGQFARMQLFNPAASGVIITVSSCVISATVTTTVRWTANAIALTTGVGVERFRDGRLAVTSLPTGQIRTDDTVAATDATGQARLSTGRTLTLEDENGVAILPPGTGFEVGSGSVASAQTATFYWRERPAEPAELNL